jgi:outer membrane lipoprotein-sorting protein
MLSRWIPLVLPVAALAAQGDDRGVAEGKALLARMIARQQDVAQMTAEYVQLRSTPLTKKPLTAKGTLAFRREPGCVVFFVREPRESVIRLDATHYEVWHKDKARLERFVLPSDEMPRLLFDALAPTALGLEQGFVVESCVPVPSAEKDAAPSTLREITLLPTDKKTKRVAAKITITLDTQGPELRGFGYRDPRGGDVRVELSNLVVAAKADPALFTLEVPKETKVTVQRIPEPKEEEDVIKQPANSDKPPADKRQ